MKKLTDNSKDLTGYRQLLPDEMKHMILDMYQYLHDFCVGHNIRYYMYFGTLLGAVRHKGFIPWDDDMDICMTRPEYEKFVNAYKKYGNQRYKVLTAQDEGFYCAFGKIIDTTTILIEEEVPDYPIGIFIDIFILDNLGNSLLQAKAFSHFVSFTKYLYQKKKDGTSPHGFLKKICALLVHVSLFPFKKSDLLRLIDKASKLLRSEKMTKYVGAVNASRYNERQILCSEWFSDAILLPFEGHNFYAPLDYKAVLKNIYVNYMDLPAEENRVPHHPANMWIKEAD